MKKLLLFLIILLASVLRLYHLDVNPPSLYWDEASLGYNAYSVLKSGKDEHGESLPLARFIAFGDYKPPGYIYTAVPSIALLGISKLAVRLPSALAGIFMVFFTYLLVNELFQVKKLALASAFIMAVSPWSLHLSRVAFEANLAAFYNLAGIYFFLKSRRLSWSILISIIFFLASFYTFNANRIIAPLLIFSLTLLYHRRVITNIKWYLMGIILAVIILLPSVGFLTSRESKIRLQEVSIFNNLQPLILTNKRIALDGNTLFAKLIHNRRIVYAKDYLKHLTDNFSLRYLFTHGDVNPRLALPGMGQLYFWELPFFISGVLYLILYGKKNASLIFSWMIIAVVPAGFAKETPHALRTVSILPTYQIIIALGLYQSIIWLKNKLTNRTFNFLLFVICYLLFVNFLYYLHLYHIHFPLNYSGEWQFGTREMVNYVLAREKFYDRIYVTPLLGRPYIFFAFYKPYLPDEFQFQKIAVRDNLGFWDVVSLGKIRFTLNNISVSSGKILLVKNDRSIPAGFRMLKVINNLAGDPVFYLSDNL